MDFNEMIEQLHFRQRNLEQQWLDTQQVWNDPVSHAFEKRYLDPTNRQAIALYSSLKSLEGVLRSIDTNCRQNGAR